MPIYRAQLACHVDSQLPRDAMVITPHFDDHGVGSDPQGLCEDLANAYVNWLGGLKHVTCKFYVATGEKPHYPVAEADVNPTSEQNSSCPREVALCLSFYSERNVPRYRGRLYMPMGAAGETTPTVRPTGQQMNRVSEFATILQDLGGVDVDWSVYSRTDKQARPVTNFWVDNEWDTVRARGLRSDSRILGSTSEA
jgi:hypothetical protein